MAKPTMPSYNGDAKFGDKEPLSHPNGFTSLVN